MKKTFIDRHRLLVVHGKDTHPIGGYCPVCEKAEKEYERSIQKKECGCDLAEHGYHGVDCGKPTTDEWGTGSIKDSYLHELYFNARNGGNEGTQLESWTEDQWIEALKQYIANQKAQVIEEVERELYFDRPDTDLSTIDKKRWDELKAKLLQNKED